MIFVVALPHAIRYIRDCADLQGDSRRVRAVKRRRRASRRRPPIGGSRPQGAALITRPCNTVSLYCTRLESTLPCIADSDLYTLYTRLRLPPRATDLYLLRVRFGRTPTLRSIVLAERPRTLHRPTGCKPTTMTTGNGIPSSAFARSFVRSGTAGEKKKSRGRIPPRDLVDFRRRSNSVSRPPWHAYRDRKRPLEIIDGERRREKRSLAVIYVDDGYAGSRLDFESASCYFNRYLAATSTLGSGVGASIEHFQRIVELACRDRWRRKRRPGSRGENDRWE